MAAAHDKRISILRITLALLLVGTVAGIAGGAFVAGREAGVFHERARMWNRDIQTAEWSGIPARFASLDELDAWGVTEHLDGDPIPLYWPDGINNEASPCRHTNVAAFGSRMWEQFPAWRAAADCDRIDTFVIAASMHDPDVSSWLSHLDPGTAPGSQSWFGIHRAPYSEMNATLARAHARIQAGDLDGAESDARAVVSAGLQFMRASLDVGGMTLSSMTVGYALDHLREIAERRGEAAQAGQILALSERIAELRSALYKLSDTTLKAAALPEQLHYAVNLAKRPDAPLGLRIHAALAIGYGGVLNPFEAVFGPGETRTQALNDLASDPVFTVALARAREPLDMSLKERYEILSGSLF